MTRSNYIPEGWPALIPRIVADEPESLVGFITEVFGARGSFHRDRPSELWIGDSLVMVSGSSERDRHGAFLYVNVEDTDSTYTRAMDRGTTSMEEPRDLPYGDRRAMVRDPWGNIWQIATHSGGFTP